MVPLFCAPCDAPELAVIYQRTTVRFSYDDACFHRLKRLSRGRRLKLC
jgi:hypothetical protein